MPQNRESGARANKWGRETARLIAKKIEATSISSNSNEFEWDNMRVTIRCAHFRVTSVGVTYLMLERVNLIIGAFEDQHGTYLLYRLRPEQYKENMRETRSKGPASGRVGIVGKSVFENDGIFLQKVRISDHFIRDANRNKLNHKKA